MQTRARRPATPSAVGGITAPGILQRKSTCGGRCASCSKKRRLARKPLGRTSELPVASRIVHEVLAAPGHPLGARLRHELEPRFGHDFSGVRVHDDARADESCRAVDAVAYTVGEHIAFAEGRFRPDSREGRCLLVHELTHVVQQDGAPASGGGHDLEIMPPDAAQEREADRVAERVLQGAPIGRLTARSPRLQLQRADEKKFSCGVEVTDLIIGAINDTRSAFKSWNDDDKDDACDALVSMSTGDVAWDIIELHEEKLHHLLNFNYVPRCATPGTNPKCDASVTVQGGCHFAGSANYVLFGVMCRLCYDFNLARVKNRGGMVPIYNDAGLRVMHFSESGMLGTISLYKRWGPWSKVESQAANLQPSKEWAWAGYYGWPNVLTPDPDRDNCVTDCPHKAAFPKFKVSWYPKLNPYKQERGRFSRSSD
jgi:hypothetical protein